MAQLSATVVAAAAGVYVQAHAPAAVAAMAAVGAKLTGCVKTLIVGKVQGARPVVLVNLEDLNQTSGSMALGKQTRALISSMTAAFNSRLKSGVRGNASILYLDAYRARRDQIAEPVKSGLSHVTNPACDLSSAKSGLGFALVCNKSNWVASTVDPCKLADNSGHQTPFDHGLIAGLAPRGNGRQWLAASLGSRQADRLTG